MTIRRIDRVPPCIEKQHHWHHTPGWSEHEFCGKCDLTRIRLGPDRHVYSRPEGAKPVPRKPPRFRTGQPGRCAACSCVFDEPGAGTLAEESFDGRCFGCQVYKPATVRDRMYT